MDIKSLEEKRANIERRFNAQNAKIEQVKNQLTLESEELLMIKGEYRAVNNVILELTEASKEEEPKKGKKNG